MYFLPLLFALVSSQEVQPDIASHPNWALLDRRDDCGHSSSDRIIGGYNARLGQYPWIVRLGYAAYPDPNNISVQLYNCGGSIINDKYILTAAHCSPKFFPGVTPDMGVDLVQVRLGEHNVNSDPDCLDGVCAPPVQDINVEEYVCHTGYNSELKQHDICLIRLVKPIQFNKLVADEVLEGKFELEKRRKLCDSSVSYCMSSVEWLGRSEFEQARTFTILRAAYLTGEEFVYPVCLPAYKKLTSLKYDRSMFEVAGWGIMDIETGNQSDILQTLAVPYISFKLCQLAYMGREKLTEKQMCVGGQMGKDSCTGDSGGPLMASLSLDGPPRYFLVGVVSYGPQDCSLTQTPGVYTNVSSYMGWILDNIRK